MRPDFLDLLPGILLGVLIGEEAHWSRRSISSRSAQLRVQLVICECREPAAGVIEKQYLCGSEYTIGNNKFPENILAAIRHSSERFVTIDSVSDLYGGKGFMSDTDGLRYTKIPLNNGSDEIPALGFGTLIPDPIATKEAVRISLEAGFRQFDCAERYRNEEQVGEAMRAVFEGARSNGRTFL